MPPRPPLDEVLALFQATVAAEGVTTGAGAAAGNSIIDAALIGVGANSFLSMLMVVYPGQPRLVDSMDITGFNNGTGEVTLSTAYKGVAAAIPAGVPYKIVTFRFVPAEVAALTALVVALMADVGDASASVLGSLYTILGNPAQNFNTMVGYEGATALASKLTAVRAALLDQITALRMAELDAANLPADVDTLKAAIGAIEGATALHNKLTAARAGYLDNLIATGPTTGTFSLVNDILEQDCLVIAAGNRLIDIELDMNNLTQINTVREYVQTDGANYRQITAKAFPTVFDIGTKCVILSFVQKNSLYKITLQASVLEGVARDVPYRYITRDLS